MSTLDVAIFTARSLNAGKKTSRGVVGNEIPVSVVDGALIVHPIPIPLPTELFVIVMRK